MVGGNQHRTILPGIRVVRGPDWIWQNQDGGEGHVGTVCEIGRSGSKHSPEQTVVVNWDSGHRSNYRIGYQGQYDLIVIDTAQIGVLNPNIICDGCSLVGIAGIRFRCAQCANFDLCATCYGNNIHDLDHQFIRYQTPYSIGVPVPARQGSVTIQLKGIFVNAKVVRGPDWEWDQQDGGEGKTGRVMEIRGWDNESCRSVANVTWTSGSTNVYRLGHKGNVDLKYVQPAIGGNYYPAHMPVLGQTEEQRPIAPAIRPMFSVGERVKVCLDKESLMKLQQGHGGWNPRMEVYLNKIGVVHRITDKGDIRVQYDGCANRWTFHPSTLVRARRFNIGDVITIISDADAVKQLQKGHGEWVETMRKALGKSGKVIKVYADGDLRIQQLDDEFVWTLNPKCVKLEPSHLALAAERSNSMMDLSHQRADHIMTPLSGLSGSSNADKFVREAAHGKLEYVQHYLRQHPDQVDVISGGKTCLQVAAHQGHVNLVRYLLAMGANVNVVDKEGDSTLHYAAFGNQPEIMRILLQHNADINVLNASHCSALHISAHKKPPHCVKVLLEFGADVNIQDSYGDTALHDAIGKENGEVVELLCNATNLDLTVRNFRGFNALHHASLKDNIMAAKKILQLARQLVNVKKDDGFAALHLAALNGHAKVVEVLVRDGLAEIDIRNNRQQTPFLLAVSQGHSAAIEKLVDLGCDILAKDEDGDNAMHLCIIKKANLVQEVAQFEAPKIYEIFQSLAHITENRLMYTILCYLAREGCRIEPNYKGARIFDWLSDKDMHDLIISYENKRSVIVVPPIPAERGPVGEAIDQQIYSNIQALNLRESGDGSSSEQQAENNSIIPIPPAPHIPSMSGISTPPTPARRHRHNNRENSTPSPSNHLNINATQHRNEDDTPVPKIPLNVESNKPIITPANRAHTISPPPLPPVGADVPTTSRFGQFVENIVGDMVIIDNISPAVNRSTAIKDNLTPPLPVNNSGRHMSRKQLANISPALPSKASQQTPPLQHPQECIVCNEVTPLITFEPCYHQISCEDCSVRMKKCLSCGTIIERRITINGRLVNFKDQNRQPSAERVRYLESRILEIEETHNCSICMERERNVAFLCGHGACAKCADTLKTCHMCRKTIGKKINLY